MDIVVMLNQLSPVRTSLCFCSASLVKNIHIGTKVSHAGCITHLKILKNRLCMFHPVPLVVKKKSGSPLVINYNTFFLLQES